jgi:hypothetical protein
MRIFEGAKPGHRRLAFIAADNFTFNDVENFSQEIRLTSDESFHLPWIVGANYAKTDIDWFQTINLTQLAGIPTSNGADAEHRGMGSVRAAHDPFADRGNSRVACATRARNATGAVPPSSAISPASTSLRERRTAVVRAADPRRRPRQGGPLDFPTTVDKDKVDFQAVLKFKPTRTRCTT